MKHVVKALRPLLARPCVKEVWAGLYGMSFHRSQNSSSSSVHPSMCSLMLDDLFFHTRGTRYWQCSCKSGGVGACVPSAAGPDGSSTAAGGALSVEGCFRDFCGIGGLEVVSILEVVFLALGDANGSLGDFSSVLEQNPMDMFGEEVLLDRGLLGEKGERVAA